MTTVTVVGAGYTGLSTAVALGVMGHTVTCTDTDSAKIETIREGRAPFYEKGIDQAIGRHIRSGTLRASSETEEAVRRSSLIFVAVGTPSREDGSFNPDQLVAATQTVARGITGKHRQTVVIKSTVLPGTTETIVIPILESGSGLPAGDFGICVNPEFLREGQAVQDSLHPSHVVIGELDRRSGTELLRLYTSLKAPKFRTSLRTAEAIKYATNAFLATKVTFANELANLGTRLHLDTDEILRGMALDPRINPRHLVPGVGFGGSCFPKDVRALVTLARSAAYEPALLDAVMAVNARQYLEAVRLLEEEIGPLDGKRIALLGLAFKAGTDDVRESRALAIASELILRGAKVVGYDPKAGQNFGRAFRGAELAKTPEEALRGAHGCIIQATWPEVVRLGSKQFSLMAMPVVIDGRRTWAPSRIPHGIRYRRIG